MFYPFIYRWLPILFNNTPVKYTGLLPVKKIHLEQKRKRVPVYGVDIPC